MNEPGLPPSELLWPHGAPGALGEGPDDSPTLSPHLLRPETATGAAVIVWMIAQAVKAAGQPG